MAGQDYTELEEASDRYVTAKQFFYAIQVLQGSTHYCGNPVFSYLPVHMLLGFCLELYFKAWLLADGVSSREIRARNYGHNLMFLHNQCLKRGFADQGAVNQIYATNLKGLVELAEQGHTSTNNYTFRYFDRRKEHNGMNVAQDIDILKELDDLVDTKVGASASTNL